MGTHLIDPLVLQLSWADHQVVARHQVWWMLAVPAHHTTFASWMIDTASVPGLIIRIAAGSVFPTQTTPSNRIAV